MNLKKLLLIIVIWQVGFVVVSTFGIKNLPIQEKYLGGGAKLFSQNPLLYSRGNFDGNHYVNIAEKGYGYAEQAFFPMYPNLIKNINVVTHNSYISGTLISMLSFVLGLWFFVKLLALDYKKEKIFWIVVVLLIFPTSFFFGAVYTESIFFLLVVSAFYFARTGSWYRAGILAALATYTRFVGIFLLPALLIEWVLQGKPKRSLGALMIIPLGLVAYMFFLNQTTGDPLAFIHTLPLFGNFRSEKIVMLYQVFWRYTKMIWTVDHTNAIFPVILLEGATGLLFLVLSIFAFIKLRLSYAIYGAAMYLVPTLTGSFVSLPRYVLICFPGFIIMGLVLERFPMLRRLYIIICLLSFMTWAGLFAAGYWVA